jgi:hypothetical protein
MFHELLLSPQHSKTALAVVNKMLTLAGLRSSRHPAPMASVKQVQEQIQIIATAIGKPAANAPTIVNVNAASRFASGRSSSIDISLAPPRG